MEEEGTGIKNAMTILTNELKNDYGYRLGWISNIAMAYKDNEHWYKTKYNKKYLNRNDKHIIANLSAEYFIEQLTKDVTK